MKGRQTMSPTEMYKEYLDNAKNFLKIGTEPVVIEKAQACAQIAQAIAATGFVTADAFDGITLATTSSAGKESLKREPAPKKAEQKTEIHVVEQPKPEVKPETTKQEAEVATTETVLPPVPPESGETKEAKDARYAWLIKNYGDIVMEKLDPKVYPYLVPEGRVNKFLAFYFEQHSMPVEDWEKYYASLISKNKHVKRSQFTIKEYLEQYIPFVDSLNYFLQFSDPNEVNSNLEKATRGAHNNYLKLNPDNITFCRISTEAYINGTLKDFEKDSDKAS